MRLTALAFAVGGLHAVSIPGKSAEGLEPRSISEVTSSHGKVVTLEGIGMSNSNSSDDWQPIPAAPTKPDSWPSPIPFIPDTDARTKEMAGSVMVLWALPAPPRTEAARIARDELFGVNQSPGRLGDVLDALRTFGDRSRAPEDAASTQRAQRIFSTVGAELVAQGYLHSAVKGISTFMPGIRVETYKREGVSMIVSLVTQEGEVAVSVVCTRGPRTN